MKRDQVVSFLFKTLRVITVLVMIVAIVFFIFNIDEINVENILNYTPDNAIAAVLMIFALYAVKSVVVVIPIVVLYLVPAILFSPFWAVVINIVGVAICITVAFFLGKYIGADYIEKHARKNRFINKLMKLKDNNEFFFSYILRVIGFLPVDLISMMLGSMNINFTKYILGSLGGMVMGIIGFTLMGSAMSDPTSPAFIGSCILTAVTTAASVAIYYFAAKSKKTNKHSS